MSRLVRFLFSCFTPLKRKLQGGIRAVLAEYDSEGNRWDVKGICWLHKNVNPDTGRMTLVIKPFLIPEDVKQKLDLTNFPQFETAFGIHIDDCSTFSHFQNQLIICQTHKNGYFLDYGFFFLESRDCTTIWDSIEEFQKRNICMREQELQEVELKTPGPRDISLSRPIRLSNVLPRESRSYTLSPAIGTHASKLSVSDAMRFPSIRAEFVVNSGKWYYEALIKSDGLMQIGWIRPEIFYPYHRGDGVGDDQYSWAYDGYRQLRWGSDQSKCSKDNDPTTGNSSTSSPFGDKLEKWESGDILGVALDLDHTPNQLSFSLNGSFMGVAFSKFDIGRGLSPAVSLSEDQSMAFVFERKYLRHAPADFEPLQDVDKELSHFLFQITPLCWDIVKIIADFYPI